MATLVGQTVSHYKIFERLGSGSMSHNHPRALRTTEGDFADPALFLREVLT